MDFDFAAFAFGGPIEVDDPKGSEPEPRTPAAGARKRRPGPGREPAGKAAPKARRKSQADQREADEEEKPTAPKAARRQAAEQAGGEGVDVEVLCQECRKNPFALRQRGLEDFFGGRAAGKSWGRNKGGAPAAPLAAPGRAEATSGGGAAGAGVPQVVEDNAEDAALVVSDGEQDHTSDAEPVDGVVFCNRCRRVMQEQRQFRAGEGATSANQRLKSYKRMAATKGVAFDLTDNEALGLMFRPCRYCGEKPPEGGHGLSRLRRGGTASGPGFMGPYSQDNVRTACAHCNLAKGHHSEEAFVEISRHITTHRGLGDFGRFPERFPINVSRRSRSSYLADSKTHALTNEQFREIVEKPCYYCGKESGSGHFNGLDRLDSTMRVYTTESCVACCGTCNIMKYRWTVQEFLDHCRRVAEHACGACGAEPDSAAEPVLPKC